MYNNTPITVEKIDTTHETVTKKTKKESASSKKESSYKKQSKETENKKKYKKNQLIEENLLDNILTLEDQPLILSDVSENVKDSYIETDTLLKYTENNKNTKIVNKKKKKHKEILLCFEENIKNVNDTNKYENINRYVKKNYDSIVNELIEHKLLRNKNTPYRIIFHIYINYLNEDMNIKLY